MKTGFFRSFCMFVKKLIIVNFAILNEQYYD